MFGNIPYIEHLGYIVEAFYHVSLGVRVVTCCSEIGGNSNSRLVRCAPFLTDVGFFERLRYCPANTSPSRATFDKQYCDNNANGKRESLTALMFDVKGDIVGVHAVCSCSVYN